MMRAFLRVNWKIYPIFLLAVMLTLCARPDAYYRYRVTVTIDTPSGPRSGSGVYAEQIDDPPRIFETTMHRTSSTTGEAIFIDLGGGKNAVVLVPAGAPGAFNRNYRPGLDPPPSLQKPPPGSKTSLLPARIYVPTIVTFGDLNDPASARLVYCKPNNYPSPLGAASRSPVRDADDFEKILGPGFGLRAATVEMVEPGIWPLNLFGITGEPVTRSIEKKLLWWSGPNRPAVVALRSAELGTLAVAMEAELTFIRN